ncbi:hypothetical protein ONZ45_g10621 [Pleurotus djamor]|nr:hypothetical protein ONZ45_g10621 [Pleurotus djamor]
MLDLLPSEVVAMIMANLDWMDIARIRRTCRIINEASRSLQLWLGIYEKLASDYDHPLPFAKYINLMSASDLETKVTDWLRVETGWLYTERPPRRRTYGQRMPYDCQIIEGGRWLIAYDSRSIAEYVYAYDLDSPGDPGTPLLDTMPLCQRLNMIVCVTDTFPRLEFDLALLCECPNPVSPAARDQVCLEVWRVVESETGLSATLTESFYTEYQTYGGSDFRDGLFAGIAPEILKLLPRRRVATIGYVAVKVYEYEPCSFDPLELPASTPTAPIYTLAMPYARLMHVIAPSYLDHANNVCILFATFDGIMRASIPITGDSQPTLSVVLPFAARHSLLGCYRLMARFTLPGVEWSALTASIGRIDAMKFNVPSDIWSALNFRCESVPHYLLMDETSGRIVEVDSSNRLTITDYKI